MKKCCKPDNCEVTISCTDVNDCTNIELAKIAADQSTSLGDFCSAVSACVSAEFEKIAAGQSSDLDTFGIAMDKILKSLTGHTTTGFLILSSTDDVISWQSLGAFSGYSGASGFSGFSGISGYSGYSGYSGKSGYSGFSGSGDSGYSGYSGSGISGYSGYSGSGVSGYSGFSGESISGYSGYSGETGPGITNGDKGDITVTGSSDIWTIDANAVTFAKIQNINSQRILGRSTAGSGNIESLTIGSNLKITAGALNTYGKTLIGISTFTSSGTWNKPSGCNAAIVYIIGAGGGGGSASSDAGEASLGTGGGAGSTLVLYKISGLGVTETVTVGLGGTGGTAGNPGNSGSDSSFGSHGTAGAGNGGLFLASGTSVIGVSGGLGGLVLSVPGDAIYSTAGEDGGIGIRTSGAVAVVSSGGSSTLGASNALGAPYSGQGSGGFGRWEENGVDVGGLDGQDGIVIVYELS